MCHSYTVTLPSCGRCHGCDMQLPRELRLHVDLVRCEGALLGSLNHRSEGQRFPKDVGPSRVFLKSAKQQSKVVTAKCYRMLNEIAAFRGQASKPHIVRLSSARMPGPPYGSVQRHPLITTTSLHSVRETESPRQSSHGQQLQSSASCWTSGEDGERELRVTQLLSPEVPPQVWLLRLCKHNKVALTNRENNG